MRRLRFRLGQAGGFEAHEAIGADFGIPGLADAVLYLFPNCDCRGLLDMHWNWISKLPEWWL